MLTMLYISSTKLPSFNVFKLYKLLMCCILKSSDISRLGEHGGARWKETVTFSHLQSISIWNFCLFRSVHFSPDPALQAWVT